MSIRRRARWPVPEGPILLLRSLVQLRRWFGRNWRRWPIGPWRLRRTARGCGRRRPRICMPAGQISRWRMGWLILTACGRGLVLRRGRLLAGLNGRLGRLDMLRSLPCCRRFVAVAHHGLGSARRRCWRLLRRVNRRRVFRGRVRGGRLVRRAFFRLVASV